MGNYVAPFIGRLEEEFSFPNKVEGSHYRVETPQFVAPDDENNVKHLQNEFFFYGFDSLVQLHRFTFLKTKISVFLDYYYHQLKRCFASYN